MWIKNGIENDESIRLLHAHYRVVALMLYIIGSVIFGIQWCETRELEVPF